MTVVLSCLAAAADAQETQPSLHIHGFGGWSYGKTDTNRFIAGNPDGNYRNVEFTLNLRSDVTDRLSVVGQLFWKQEESEDELKLDYAFAEWKLSDSLKLRLGKVKFPFGIYAELFDIGTLRPFLSPPQAIYGKLGFSAEDFKGIGLTGERAGPAGWELAYDAYVGGLELEEDESSEEFVRGHSPGEGEGSESLGVISLKNVVGGRLILRAPVDGLSFGTSGYIGSRVSGGTSFRAFAVQGEYLWDPWLVRAEVAQKWDKQYGDTANGGYLEVAYWLTPHWQAAGQWGRTRYSIDSFVPPSASSLFDHQEQAIGLNYWFTRQFVVKLAYHRVTGNLLAGPDPSQLADLIAAGRLDRTTNLAEFGVNYSF